MNFTKKTSAHSKTLLSFALLFFVSISVLLTGCSKPVIDAANERMFDRSLETILNDAPVNVREDIVKAIQIIVYDTIDIDRVNADISRGMPKEKAQNLQVRIAQQRINGLNYEEIIALALELREKYVE